MDGSISCLTQVYSTDIGGDTGGGDDDEDDSDGGKASFKVLAPTFGLHEQCIYSCSGFRYLLTQIAATGRRIGT